MTPVPAVMTSTVMVRVQTLESGMTGSVQSPKSWPRSARAMMPVPWSRASAIVR